MNKVGSFLTRYQFSAVITKKIGCSLKPANFGTQSFGTGTETLAVLENFDSCKVQGAENQIVTGLVRHMGRVVGTGNMCN